jgi:hypothetical protein
VQSARERVSITAARDNDGWNADLTRATQNVSPATAGHQVVGHHKIHDALPQQLQCRWCVGRHDHLETTLLEERTEKVPQVGLIFRQQQASPGAVVGAAGSRFRLGFRLRLSVSLSESEFEDRAFTHLAGE